MGQVGTVQLLLDKGALMSLVNKEGWSVLAYACKGGSCKMIEFLLAKGFEVDQRTDYSTTPLMIAGKHGCGEAVKLLLDKGAEVDLVDKGGMSALAMASKDGRCEVVVTLLDRGAQVDLQDKWKRTPLEHACANNCYEVVKLLLGKGAEIGTLQNVNMGYRCLSEAISREYWKIAELLLEKGVHVDVLNDRGETVLMSECDSPWEKKVGAIKFLLDKGAQLNLQDKYGNTALMCAVSRKRHKIVQVLLEDIAIDLQDEDGCSAFMKSCCNNFGSVSKDDLNLATLLIEKGDLQDIYGRSSLMRALSLTRWNEISTELLDFLLDKGAQVNLQDKDGTSALMQASRDGKYDVAKLLLERGALTDLQDKNGTTALMFSSQNKNLEVLGLLLESGARVDLLGGFYKRSVLMDAAGEGDHEVIKLLLEKGSYSEGQSKSDVVNLCNSKGWTALKCAVSCGHDQVARLLLTNGALLEPSHLDTALRENSEGVAGVLMEFGAQFEDNGSAYLANAVLSGREEFARLLLKAGAKPDGTDEQRTPLMTAACKNNFKMAKLLLEYGAEVHRVDDFGRTPFTFACDAGSLEMAQLLVEHGAEVDHADAGGVTAFVKACIDSKTEVVQFLLQNGAKVNQSISVFAHVCSYGLLEIAKLLLENGISIDSDVLFTVCKEGKLEMVRLLLEYGAEVDCTDGNGKTPLMIACRYGKLETACLLLERGADVDHTDGDGANALISMCRDGNAKIVQLLLKNGATVDYQVEYNAFLVSCSLGELDIMQLLVEAGARVDQTTRIGRTALMEASRHGKLEVVRLLLEMGANVNLCPQKLGYSMRVNRAISKLSGSCSKEVLMLICKTLFLLWSMRVRKIILKWPAYFWRMVLT